MEILATLVRGDLENGAVLTVEESEADWLPKGSQFELQPSGVGMDESSLQFGGLTYRVELRGMTVDEEKVGHVRLKLRQEVTEELLENPAG
ncbi:hypothetical protein HNR42_001685 [Deinobacterium chartae]|uniref:Uncharacterized protein n=1 Tax=Deinobacterium chartae TaxID=521158 RepID=A0A841I1F2_9DEIO|nr:hypothetical protein [Deinobacterium chartae]MBB6098260.1 hypothetical protein [Deinobacterium chartae]